MVALRAPAHVQPTLRGNGSVNRVLIVHGGTVTLEGLRFTGPEGGFTTPGGQLYGGGVEVQGGRVTFARCSFDHNILTGLGDRGAGLLVLGGQVDWG